MKEDENVDEKVAGGNSVPLICSASVFDRTQSGKALKNETVILHIAFCDDCQKAKKFCPEGHEIFENWFNRHYR